MQKLRKQKGITLIALIITIIVMLILVGVTVSVSLNGGLFEKTKQAGSDMQREVDRETLYELVLASIGNDGKVDFTVLDGKAATTGFTKIADKTYKSAKGNTFTVGDYGQITYEGESNPVTPPVEPDVETVAVASFVQNGTTIKGLDANGQEVATLEVGQQIAYDCYDETLTDEQKAELLYHKATIAETGNTTEQQPYGTTIEGADGTEPEFEVTASDESRVWNILGVDNGKLLITTDPVGSPLKLAFPMYNGTIDMPVLNNICAIYGHGKYAESARNIKMTDITSLTGTTIRYSEPTVDTSSVKDSETLRGVPPSLNADFFGDHALYNILDGNFWLDDFDDITSWGYFYNEDTQTGNWDEGDVPLIVGLQASFGNVINYIMISLDYTTHRT